MAAALALATAATFAARLWWPFDLFTHFRLQYVALALLLAILALVVQAYGAAVLLVGLVLVHGWAIKDLWLGDVAPPAGRSLRVVSANVLDANPTPDQVLAFARASAADLLLLVDAQSPRWRPILAAIGDIYPYQAPDGWRDGAPVILFSRLPIETYSVGRPPEGRRPYLVAELVVEGGALTVIGFHPASPSPTDGKDTRWRNRALDHIAEVVDAAAGPAIVAGDFNTSPWSPHFRDLIAATGLRNAAAGHGWIGTWPRWFWPVQVPIDHVLVNGPLAVAGFARGPAIGSDHYPVIADLKIVND